MANQDSGLIRNNTLSIHDIGGRKLAPGATERFTLEELQPFAGSKAFRAHFTKGDLQEIPENAPPPPDFLRLREDAPTVPAKPDVSKLGEGTPIRVDTKEGKEALAAFLQDGVPQGSAPALVPEIPPEAPPASNTPAQ